MVVFGIFAFLFLLFAPGPCDDFRRASEVFSACIDSHYGTDDDHGAR
jgi:hypothetical protein